MVVGSIPRRAVILLRLLQIFLPQSDYYSKNTALNNPTVQERRRRIRPKRNRPTRSRHRQEQQLPLRPLGQTRQHGPPRANALPRLLSPAAELLPPPASDGSAVRRLWLGRAVLRCALEPVCEPDLPARHGCAAGAVSGSACAWGGGGCACDE